LFYTLCTKGKSQKGYTAIIDFSKVYDVKTALKKDYPSEKVFINAAKTARFN